METTYRILATTNFQKETMKEFTAPSDEAAKKEFDKYCNSVEYHYANRHGWDIKLFKEVLMAYRHTTFPNAHFGRNDEE